jgi:hypothetical protein
LFTALLSLLSYGARGSLNLHGMQSRAMRMPYFKKVNIMSKQSNHGGGDHASHEQHVKAGQQSHKNQDSSSSKSASSGSSSRGGSHEQHVKAGQQSHKNDR